MTKHLEKYVVLDEITMMLHRPDTFIGSVESKTLNTYIFEDIHSDPVWRNVTYNPALLKLFDEVLQNCSDHSKRPEGKHLNKIDVTISPMDGLIIIADNGGIPVEMHPEYKKYIPCLIFGELRSGTNYDDTEAREGAGRNGLGAKLTNIFSTYFKVETSDGKKKYEKLYTDNRKTESEPIITNSKNKLTRISFVPDYERLGCSLDIDNYGMIITRIFEIAACSPNIEITINGVKIDVKGFKTFVEKFGSDSLYVESDGWKIGLHHAGSDGFKHITFVNSTHTWLGGTHLDYISDQLVEGIRGYIKTKTKQDVKPSDIKNHFFVMIDCTVHNPRFSSQTKEQMNLAVSKFGTSFKFEDKFFKLLAKSPIVAEIIEWAMDKKAAQDARDLANINKDSVKSSRKTIKKYEPASEKVNRQACTLFICEGDSAANPLISARNPKLHGVFNLRGKPLNMGSAKIEEIKKNEEIKNLMLVLGLEFNKPAKDLRYGRIVLAMDADMDGYHIIALNLNNFKTKWPNLLVENKIFTLHTPIVRATKGKDVFEFFTMEEYEIWNKKASGKISVEFLKGLGGNSTSNFKKYMFEDKYIIPMEYSDQEDIDALNIAFGDASDKKPWLNCES